MAAGSTEEGPQFGRQSVGVIGLGMIGGAVAGHVAAAGFPLAVHDLRPGATDGIPGAGPVLADPAAVAAVSEVVLVAVVNAGQVREVLGGERGLLAAGRDGLVVGLLSTVELAEVREFAQLCAEHGATLLDAGVTQAGDGLLVTMVGGPEEVVARVRPVLAAFSKDVVHCGPLGAGMTTKIARNIVGYSCWAAVREAMSVAAAGGVDPGTLLAVLEAAASPRTAPLAMAIRQRDDPATAQYRAPITGALADKDLAAAQALAREIGIGTPIVDVIRPFMPATFEGDFAPVART